MRFCDFFGHKFSGIEPLIVDSQILFSKLLLETRLDPPAQTRRYYLDSLQGILAARRDLRGGDGRRILRMICPGMHPYKILCFC